MSFLNLAHKKVILASASPRRSFLLNSIGIKHEVQKINFTETLSTLPLPEKTAEEIAKSKINQINNIKDNHIYITADTTVIQDSRVLGKPINELEAKKTLKAYSGKSHLVITGVCIASSDKKISFSATTKVHFMEISNQEIDYYIKNHKPFDKAGSYGIQEWFGATKIKSITGCYYNVMGLPTQMVYSALKCF